MSRSRLHPLEVVLIAALAAVVGLILASCGGESKKPGSCKADQDCKAGQVCVDNRCVECKEDAQCPQGQKCSANACVASAECTKDEQCPLGQVCQAGKCKACASDNECGPGGSCEAGACKRASKCAKNEDCADDEDCVNGYCRKATAGNQGDATCPLATVYFGYDEAVIKDSEKDRLDANAQCIEKTIAKVKDKQVLLLGHTDTSGTEEYNIALSERRAQSVADYLARLGVDPARMQIVPKGETEPTGAGDDKDRRCEFQWR
jgi:peptidoglycan-associated lipoprotein